jgi:hypothetical protein
LSDVAILHGRDEAGREMWPTCPVQETVCVIQQYPPEDDQCAWCQKIISSPQSEDRYKTLSKRMGTMVQLIGPHTPTGVDMLAQLLFQVNLEGVKDAESVAYLDEESYLKMIKERVTEIGPLVREVFAKDAYNHDRPAVSNKFITNFVEIVYSSLAVNAAFIVAANLPWRYRLSPEDTGCSLFQQVCSRYDRSFL